MSANKAKIDNSSNPGAANLAPFGLPIAAGTVAVQAWADLGAETVRFIQDRLQQDIKTQQAMLNCTSLEALQKIQGEFFTAAQTQYTAEAAKMLSLMGNAASGLSAPLKA